MAEWAGRVPAPRLRALLERMSAGALPGPLAKQALAWLLDEPGDVDAVLAAHGVRAQGSADELRPLVRAVLAEHASAVAEFRAGRAATWGFLVGQVMKRSGGQAVPQVVQALLREELALPPEG
jgi:aspartyl-tRNA(Asn)/glutamyl-tRNA(Gln) amidotransferase subunit B